VGEDAVRFISQRRTSRSGCSSGGWRHSALGKTGMPDLAAR